MIIIIHTKPFGSIDDIRMYILTTYVVNYQIDDKEDLDIIDKIYPIEKIREEYHPYVINSMSFSKNYHRDIYYDYKNDVKKIFIKYIFKHPRTLIKHYKNVDNLLFGLNCERDERCYIYVYEFSKWNSKYSGNFDEIVKPKIKRGYDFYLNLINRSFDSKIGKILYMPAFSFYLSIIIIIYICIKKKSKKYLIVILPMIFNTISLMFINLAQDARYAYIDYLTLLMLAIPILLFEKRKGKEIKVKKNKIKNPKTLIIVPAYNEGMNIEKTIKDITENTNYDYVVINDCSKDNTLEICKKNNYNVLSLPVNFGLTSGIQLGMKYAKENNYDIAIQFDGDGQHQAKYLKKLVDKMCKDNCDIVIGSRFVDQKKPFSARMLGSRLLTGAIKFVTGKKINDPTSGMRAYSRNGINEFCKNASLTPEPDTLVYMIKHGYKVEEIQVEMKDREFGESYLSPMKSIKYMTNMILSILLIRSIK